MTSCGRRAVNRFPEVSFDKKVERILQLTLMEIGAQECRPCTIPTPCEQALSECWARACHPVHRRVMGVVSGTHLVNCVANVQGYGGGPWEKSA